LGKPFQGLPARDFPQAHVWVLIGKAFYQSYQGKRDAGLAFGVRHFDNKQGRVDFGEEPQKPRTHFG